MAKPKTETTAPQDTVTVTDALAELGATKEALEGLRMENDALRNNIEGDRAQMAKMADELEAVTKERDQAKRDLDATAAAMGELMQRGPADVEDLLVSMGVRPAELKKGEDGQPIYSEDVERASSLRPWAFVETINFRNDSGYDSNVVNRAMDSLRRGLAPARFGEGYQNLPPFDPMNRLVVLVAMLPKKD